MRFLHPTGREWCGPSQACSPAARGTRPLVDDFFTTEAEAVATLEQVLAEAPELEGLPWVERVELTASPN